MEITGSTKICCASGIPVDGRNDENRHASSTVIFRPAWERASGYRVQ